jgi:hypothetical protein
MRCNRRPVMMGGIVCILLLSGCIVRDSPAPGCVESIGIPGVGGCFGKTAIVNLSLEATPACVVVEANNCNGGVLEIRNACEETMRLGEIEISASSSVSLDIRQAAGSIEVFETDSNFSEYIPETDQRIDIAGTLGDQAFSLAYTKTQPLCK